MGFKEIEDYKQLDALWEAGLLWVRSGEHYPWAQDCTFVDGWQYKPSNDAARFPENTYEYAILLEE